MLFFSNLLPPLPVECDDSVQRRGREGKAGIGWHHLVDREGSAGSLNCLSISFPLPPHTEWRLSLLPLPFRTILSPCETSHDALHKGESPHFAGNGTVLSLFPTQFLQTAAV